VSKLGQRLKAKIDERRKQQDLKKQQEELERLKKKYPEHESH